jgi:hypothetical protein
MNACTLTRTFTAVALFAAAAAMTTTALAQDDNTPRSRADVNAEALAAMKAGELAAGEGTPTVKSPTASTKTREARKAETLLARSRDELVHSGIATYRASISQQTATAHSTRTRAERKAETMESIKHKQTMPAGEAA